MATCVVMCFLLRVPLHARHHQHEDNYVLYRSTHDFSNSQDHPCLQY